MLPLLVLAIPILDTTLVTVRRTIERRPVTRGGTDHSSHRLVYYGLSEQQAVAALTLLAALLGATALAYNVLANPRVTAVGLLISFVVLVQFASFLGDLQERSAARIQARRRRSGARSSPTPAACRGADGLRDHLLLVPGVVPPVRRRRRHEHQRALFLATLPILLGVTYVLFVLFGIYRRIWRFASARDLLAIAGAVGLSVPLTIGIVRAIRRFLDFPLEIFFVDALLCMTLVAASRLGLRLLPVGRARIPQQRVLIVGAGRSGRALARELAETPETRVVGFVDDNPALRRRRIHGVTVHGSSTTSTTCLATSRSVRCW